MAKTSTQRLVDAVKTRLTADLPARLTAASLPAIGSIVTHQPMMVSPDTAPLIWVDVAEEKRTEETMGRYRLSRALLVGVTSSGTDGDVAASNLRQTVDAIRVSLEAQQYTTGQRPLGGEADYVSFAKAEFSPNISGGSGLFQEAVLYFDVPRLVSRGQE